MGSKDGEGDADERPRHKVTILKAFALGRYAVTFDEWDAAVAAGGVKHKPSDQGWGRGRRRSSTSTGTMRRLIYNGFPAKLASLTGCQARRNGNIAAGRGRRRLIPSATALRSSRRSSPRAVMAVPARLLRLAHSQQTHSACTACMAMSGNGARIAGTRITIMHRPIARRGQLEIVAGGCFAAVPGSTIQRIAAPPPATGTPRATASTIAASVWPGP